MAPCQAKPEIQKIRRQPSLRRDQVRRPRGIKKERPQTQSRKSARLEQRQRNQEQTVSKDRNTKLKHTLLIETPHTKDRKRKRSQQEEPSLTATNPFQKRRRTSLLQSAVEDTPGGEEAASSTSNKGFDPIEHWVKKRSWPEGYSKQDDQTKKDLEKDSWYEKYWVPDMNHLLARKKSSSSSLRRKQLDAGSVTARSTTPSDQKPRDVKSAPYQDPRYKTVLASKGSFMDESGLGITDKSNDDLQTLLSAKQSVPKDSLFRNDIFKSTCRNIQDRNETRVIRDISLLIVPSAETLATYGATNLQCLIESTNEGWKNSIPITQTRPQPDFAVGFRREAFTEDQLRKLEPFVGNLTDTSFFMATYYMYFPFLTCEVKCGAAALDVADRQNAHSATMEVRGIVELFRLVKREEELHREILAFSLSHDHSSVRIYGHYAIIDGSKTTFYRHPIKKFDFTSEKGKDKWTALMIVKNIYEIWMPPHFRRICSVIDDLPSELDFEVSQQSEFESGLSQGLESHHLSDQSSFDAASQEDADSQSSRAASRDVTPDTSLSHGAQERAAKKPKKRGRPVELHQ